MASIAPITDALNAPAAAVPPNPTAAAQAAQQAAQANTTEAGQIAAQTAAATATQPIDLVFDALALDSSYDETLFTSTAVEGTGAYSVFMGELFAALAAQQTAQAQATAQANPATAPATTTATAAPPSTATQPAAAAAEFASNAATAAPNSALESDVQALASQVQAASTGTTDTAAAGTLAPLQQSFDDLVASTGGAATAASLPTFLQTLANNLHSVQSPLGNIVNAQI
jgi:trimeric autotransporter adhesin